jgi:hypothetical protein
MTATAPALTGTVIHGTLLSQDVIPAVLGALRVIGGDAAHAAFLRQWPMPLIETLLRRDADPDMTDSEADSLMWLWDDLFDAVDGLLPDGWYFGSLEGDGTDFGVWEV